MSGKVLVVIPTLNRPKLCARAVESVLRQKYWDWYLVVAINGMPECMDDWAIKEQKYKDAIGDLPLGKGHYMSCHEAGLGVTLNAVLKPALLGECQQFDYWMNLEDDDKLYPDYLKVMVDALETSGADVVNCLQRQEPRKLQSAGGAMNADYLQSRNWINWPECLWRREVYERVGPVAEDVGPATDWDYHLRAVKAGIKYHFVGQTLVIHHWHNDNYCLHVDGKGVIAKKKAEGAYR